MRLYKYVGSPDFIPKGEFPVRTKLESVDVVHSWMNDHRDELDIEECIAATYVIDREGLFWIADRSSEHVACARVGEVLSAGEVFLVGLMKCRILIELQINRQDIAQNLHLGMLLVNLFLQLAWHSRLSLSQLSNFVTVRCVILLT